MLSSQSQLSSLAGRGGRDGLTAHTEHLGAPQAGVIRDLVLLACVGIRPVLVHGGGPEINSWLGKLGIEAEFKNGLRVTDGAPPPMNHIHLRVGSGKTLY